jgi:hypothetical protein
MYELARAVPDVKMLLALAPEELRWRMARAEPPRAMESAADFKSFKAHGVRSFAVL